MLAQRPRAHKQAYMAARHQRLLDAACRRAEIFLGTPVVVYGLFMAPIGWRLALIVWAYALVAFFIAIALKVGTYWLLDHRAGYQVRHLARVERSLHNHH